MALNKYKLGDLITISEDKNGDGKYGISDVKGVSIEKKFIETKANMDGVSLNPYLLVKPDDFCYVTVTSRNSEKITIAYNSTNDTYIVSSSYIVFRVSRPDLLDSTYLFMYFRRPEFDRYSRFNSWGSARETFSWEDMSKAKFWQMIGRGTRLCPGLLDGKDKNQFYIFDFCGNFEFFRMNPKGKNVPMTTSVQERIFDLKTNLIYKLQDLVYQTDELIAFRNSLIEDVTFKIKELNRENFSVKQHLKFIDLYSDKKSFEVLTPLDLQQLSEEIAPMILPYGDEISAVRFDALMYGIELGYIAGNTYSKGIKDLMGKVRAVAKVGTIPAVKEQKDFINQILNTDYVERATINEFETIREKLRELIKYIPRGENPTYETDFDDDILSMDWHKSDLDSDDLQNYKMKVNYYIRNHMDVPAIAKLHTNQPLTAEDIKSLEEILWGEIGTKEDYQAEYQDKPLGELVREIVGLDMNSAKQAFSKYLNDVNLDDRQIYFVNQIINYVVQNGMMKNFAVMQEAPFTDKGDVGDIFTDTVIWLDIMKIIKSINANAMAA